MINRRSFFRALAVAPVAATAMVARPSTLQPTETIHIQIDPPPVLTQRDFMEWLDKNRDGIRERLREAIR